MQNGNSGLLAVDVGNTNIHFGLWRENSWQLSWRARTIAEKMPDEYAVLLRNFLSSADMSYSLITGVVIGSVVPPLTSAFVEMVQRYIGIDPLVVTNKTNTGVRIEIEQPEQAGADRIINSAAVVALYGGPAIVIDFGTATTFDVVSRDGAYSGGAIAPGIVVAHDALVSRTARLHKVDLVPPPNPIGKNTIHAMQSGIFWGYVSLVEGLVTRIKASMNEPDIKVIATGGLAPLFQQHTTMIDTIAPELTLDGLRIIYEINQNKQ
ncbi:MAG: type III pantothenate kinase [Anaerolineae bacterium]|nr:type III pantothenate kinase [Anaerolineae bacterium]